VSGPGTGPAPGAGQEPGSAQEPGTGQELSVPCRLLHPEARLPTYAHPGDAGADLRCLAAFTLAPGERRLVGTGLALALPQGYAGFVHPRSGLAARHGVTVVNSPGTVDAGYRGEVLVCLLNTDREQAVAFAAGDRIAQLVVQRVERAAFTVVEELSTTPRGFGGHGSTGEC